MKGHITLNIGQQNEAGGQWSSEGEHMPSKTPFATASYEEDDPMDLTGGPWFTEDIHLPHGISLQDVVDADTEATRSSSTAVIDLEVERVYRLLQRLTAPVSVTVIDYSSQRSQHHTGITTQTLPQFLSLPRPEWSKVRWIHLEGISGDALQTLGIAFGLHPLSLEDITQFQRIKVDAFDNYLAVYTHVWQLEHAAPSAVALREEPLHGGKCSDSSSSSSDESGGEEEGGGPGSDAAILLRQLGKADRTSSAMWRQMQTLDLADADMRRISMTTARAAAHARDRDKASLVHLAEDVGLGRHPQTPVEAVGTTVAAAAAAAKAAAAANKGLRQSRDAAAAADSGSSSMSSRLKSLHSMRSMLKQQRSSGSSKGLKEGLGSKEEGSNSSHEDQQQPQHRRQVLQLHKRCKGAGESDQVDNSTAQGNQGRGNGGSSQHSRGQQGNGSSHHPGGASGNAGASKKGHTGTFRSPTPHHSNSASGPSSSQGCTNLRMPLQAPFFGRLVASAFHKRRVVLEQASFFLLPDGVLISIFPSSSNVQQQQQQREAGISGGPDKRAKYGPESLAAGVVAPVMARLRGMQSLINESEDASFLLQELLESCLDFSYPVFNAYVDKVLSLDRQVLQGRATMDLTYKLHILLTDLSILIRSVAPIQGLLANLHKRAAVVAPPPALGAAGALHHGPPVTKEGHLDLGALGSPTMHPAAAAGGHPAAAAAAGGVVTPPGPSKPNANTHVLQSSHSPWVGEAHRHNGSSSSSGGGGGGSGSGHKKHGHRHGQKHRDAEQQQRDQELLQDEEGEVEEQEEEGGSQGQEEESMEPQQQGHVTGMVYPQQQQEEEQEEEQEGDLHTQSWPGEAVRQQVAAEALHRVPGPASRTARVAAGGGASRQPSISISSGSSSTSASGMSMSGVAQGVTISPLAKVYLEDLLDEIILADQDLTALADHAQRLLDLVVNSVAQANSSANTTLTVLSTIFLPLTFIAGVYGMNFNNMPELQWELGYLYCWMLFLAILLIAGLLMWWYDFVRLPWILAWLNKLREAHLERRRRRHLTKEMVAAAKASASAHK